MLKYCTCFQLILLVILLSCTPQNNFPPEINIVGAMRNVMMKGQLQGRISLDTIANKTHLYGLGPLEYLTGEIFIVDGHAFKSTIKNDSTMVVEERFELKAPFFVYANISAWSNQVLPDSIETMQQLEHYLDKIFSNRHTPVAFKIEGTVTSANIHVVNLPAGSKVQSPQDAHVGQLDFKIENDKVEIVGFFSRKHKSIFTHHDSFVHMHLITEDRKMMGHLDKLILKKSQAHLWVSY